MPASSSSVFRGSPALAFIALTAFAPGSATAQSSDGPAAANSAPTRDKSAYTVFNPTPREQMRDLSTDRPDQTESPYTVDAGHWQVELDFVNVVRDDEEGVRTETFSLAPVNVKLGLTAGTDIQFIFDSFSRERVSQPGQPRLRIRDWGDLTVRLKANLWGNDDTTPGATAAAVMPFVKLPLNLGDAGNELVEGGLILPLAISLPGDTNLGLMTEIDWVADGAGRARHAEWLNSVTVSRGLAGNLGGYLELVAVFTNEPGASWQGQVDVGLTYAVSADLQLDAGCNFGVTRSAPDFQPFAGISLRY